MKLSAIVISFNAEKKIGDCLKSLEFADEVLVVDSGSTDRTIKIAEQEGVRVISVNNKGFSHSRNVGAKKARGEWLLYIDADEGVSQNLREKILGQVTSHKSQVTSFLIYRKNVILGKWLRHGGWWPDPVHRLIKRSALKKWEGELHERPVVKGEVGLIEEPIVHRSKDSVSEMVANSRQFAPIEARLMLKAGHPPVKVYHFILAMAREFWRRGLRHAGWLDGVVGVIEIIYQMFHQVFVHATLWQLQLKEK